MYMLMIKQQMSKKIYTYEMLFWASPLVIQRFSFHCHLCGKKLSNYLGGNGKEETLKEKKKEHKAFIIHRKESCMAVNLSRKIRKINLKIVIVQEPRKRKEEKVRDVVVFQWLRKIRMKIVHMWLFLDIFHVNFCTSHFCAGSIVPCLS